MAWWNPLTWFGSEDEKTGEPVAVPKGIDRLTGGDVELRAGLEKLRAYAESMITALDALDEQPPEDKPAESADMVGWKNSVRNRVLAGSGEKAAFFGTISTEPVIAARDLQDMGFDVATAEALIDERDKMRAAAFDVAPVVHE